MYTLRLECEDDNGRWKFVSLDKVKDELKDKADYDKVMTKLKAKVESIVDELDVK